MSQARVSFISDYQLRNEQVLALPKPRSLAFGIPFHAIVAMVIIGLTGVCITVTLRTQAELHAAAAEHTRLRASIEKQAAENQQLQFELNQLDRDPRAIERSAREMGWVKSNEVVIILGEPVPVRTPTLRSDNETIKAQAGRR
ncbi:MAG: septum formation initiator family protein [Chloracidobacterium sp.]|uniref:Septum formation initiator family protein n=1 Tax=Chloracidobacterium validum TaxID=2821543 RepID=A0ABX8B5L1_9BACT|nr:septum formation initiator family protein [Chloracidobacterium validum]QUW02262.1 septum formation initiator family protein [Chloracidobacterium validum]